MEVRSVLPPDAIPSVDDPAFGPDYFGDPDDEVIVVDLEGAPARAYPVRVLHYHEILTSSRPCRDEIPPWAVGYADTPAVTRGLVCSSLGR